MPLHLSFHGAAECVTGSCMRLRGAGFDVLIDCGMFQGPKTLKALNYDPFPFDAAGIDAVLLTHAHIDHSGLLPKLWKAGFRGRIFATAPARDLCRVMLADAGDIQEHEVRQLNRRNAQRGLDLVEPIYTTGDAAQTMELFQRIKLEELVEIAPGLQARWWSAGHMLGAASIEVLAAGDGDPVRLLFSGDLGPADEDYLAAPKGPAGVDHLILESTYGDRVRPTPTTSERRRRLAEELEAAHAAGGPLLVPVFAVGRAQEVLLDLLAVMAEGSAPAGEIFLDSPLAIEATDVFLQRGWNSDTGENPYLPLRHADHLRFLLRPDESDRLEKLGDWHIILAGSGMCDAGRIRRHLKRLLWRRQTTVLLAGYQAKGTLGRLLQDGASEVRIQGAAVRVNARIRTLDVYSGHADAEGLAAWAAERRPVAGQVFLNHGEPEALSALQERLAAAGFARDHIRIPVVDQGFALTRDTVLEQNAGSARIAPGRAAREDWHNARAAFLVQLNETLQAAASDEAREKLLEDLQGRLTI
ncbi:MAG: MBL fold metallo-hydrolase [Phenylobacterium sp.]|uniref:MBL fold metallo-hydrolase RNA specificity domain-containing protein n=1 Tax=Phenylobacterium sp. TaxID=1871053 RepID=UPI00271C9C6E|nr:MBL fold metallo-hydrolase [Phenylobacterium sp.]MDO8411837.1 MBL fold metallo-hydrolase [Phenylobacterium sp.]